MAYKCDVHPDEEAQFHLEGPHGECYEVCSIEDLRMLINHVSVTINHALPPCGHDGPDSPATWPSAVGTPDDQ